MHIVDDTFFPHLWAITLAANLSQPKSDKPNK